MAPKSKSIIRKDKPKKPPRPVPRRAVLLKSFNAEAEGLATMHVEVAKQVKRLKLEEQKLMHLLLQLRGALPEDCPAFVGENGELHERIRDFQANFGGNSAEAPLHSEDNSEGEDEDGAAADAHGLQPTDTAREKATRGEGNSLLAGKKAKVRRQQAEREAAYHATSSDKGGWEDIMANLDSDDNEASSEDVEDDEDEEEDEDYEL